MMHVPTLMVRADAGGRLGTGHVMRMLALAQAWQDRGGRVIWAFVRCPQPLVNRLRSDNVELHEWTHCEPGDLEDARLTRERAQEHRIRVLVLDNYHFSTAYQSQVWDDAWTLMCVDDYGHCREWHADVLLNQNPPARRPTAEMLRRGPQTMLLWGERYALLRREFRIAALAPPAQLEHRHLLITFGGVDPIGATQRVLDSLERGQLDSWQIRVIVGPGNVFLEELQARAAASKYDIELLVAVNNMVEQYLWADRVISAAGSSCYEWMSLRKVAWVGVIADNQREVAQHLQQQRLATVWQSEDWNAADALDDSLHRWLATAVSVPEFGFSAEGAVRVVGALWPPTVEMAMISSAERAVNSAEAGAWKWWGCADRDWNAAETSGVTVTLRDEMSNDFAIAQLTKQTGEKSAQAELNVWFRHGEVLQAGIDATVALGQLMRCWGQQWNIADWLVSFPEGSEAQALGLAILSPLGFVFSIGPGQTVLGHCRAADLLPM